MYQVHEHSFSVGAGSFNEEIEAGCELGRSFNGVSIEDEPRDNQVGHIW